MSTFDPQASVCPRFSAAEAQALAREHYGVSALKVRPLGSFQDQNFQLVGDDGREFVLKIANAATSFDELDLQNRALAHLAARDAAFPTPRLIAARGGDDMPVAERDGERYFVRLLTFMPGRMLAHITSAPGPALLATIGQFAGVLAHRLRGFDHPAGAHVSQWDMRHAPEVVRAFLPYVAAPEHRALIGLMLERYEAHAAPLLARLPTSMIHCDITSYNLLLSHDDTGRLAVSGLIDFGDMVRSYTIGELAVAVSEGALSGAYEPLAAAAPMVVAYHRERPLGDDELAVLFPMVCLRRCVVAVSVAQQLHFEPENAYVRELSEQDWPVLRQLRDIAPELALASLRAACGLEPYAGAAAVRGWLAENHGRMAPVVPPELLDGAPALDLGVGSELLRDGVWQQPRRCAPRSAQAPRSGATARCACPTAGPTRPTSRRRCTLAPTYCCRRARRCAALAG
ncbi:phosphotransferase [Kouleothrix sp.]|uniref:phosphotransferase n=1 Tax=Kouleothrix sp. TaxID=2779161 RepID=UPI00391952D6